MGNTDLTNTERILTDQDLAYIYELRKQFPMLSQPVNGQDYVYLDNSATTLKPQRVIDRLTNFYTNEYATVHRGVYSLSQEATDKFDHVRDIVKNYLNAASSNEIVFVRGCTEAINLVAHSYGALLEPGDEILVSELEHHANMVPWQVLAQQKGLTLKVIPMTESGELDMDAYKMRLSNHTAMVAVNHVSNATGTVNPIKEIIDLAHEVDARVLIDGAQAAGHLPVDVQALDCDFYTLSSHKLFGPTGAGALYGKANLLEKMPPYQTGGAMIERVTTQKTTYAPPPARFEAGTPAIAEVIGFGEALLFIQEVGLDRIARIENALLEEATAKIGSILGVRIIGEAPEKASVLSFVFDNVHPHDAGSILDESGIAVRVGHHCAQPVMQFFGVAATIRASFSVYNLPEEIDKLVAGIYRIKEVMGEL